MCPTMLQSTTFIVMSMAWSGNRGLATLLAFVFELTYVVKKHGSHVPLPALDDAKWQGWLGHG